LRQTGTNSRGILALPEDDIEEEAAREESAKPWKAEVHIQM
jgi:hypothetical protein